MTIRQREMAIYRRAFGDEYADYDDDQIEQVAGDWCLNRRLALSLLTVACDILDGTTVGVKPASCCLVAIQNLLAEENAEPEVA